MNQRLGTKKRHARGLYRQGEDAMRGVLIEPTFYALLKEEGLPTARRADGSYWNDEAQTLWEWYKMTNERLLFLKGLCEKLSSAAKKLGPCEEGLACITAQHELMTPPNEAVAALAQSSERAGAADQPTRP